MFLGYQGDLIAFAAETREELENLPCVVLDRIEETSDTYVLHGNKYMKIEDIDPNDEVIANRIKEYPAIEDQLDMLYWDMENNTTVWKDTIKSIKQKYPKISTVDNEVQ